MKKTRASLSIFLVGLLAAACVGVSPGPTVSIPPINIPTLPPINVPTIPPVNVPSLPPINIPTIPPINIPSIPPIELPSGLVIPTIPPIEFPSGDPTSGVCPLVTPAEMGAAMGGQASVTASDSTSCTYTFANFSSVIITIQSSTDLTSSRFLFGDTAKDVTVGGLPDLTGVFIGQPAVHVQRGTDQLQVLGILTGSEDAVIARLVQVATTAVSRWQ